MEGRNRIKNFFKSLSLATAIFVGYGFFYTQFDTSLIKALSKKKEFITGLDFEAYNQKERISIVKKIENPTTAEVTEVENWSLYVSMDDVWKWQNLSYANALGFTPYNGNIETYYRSDDEKEKSSLEILAEGDTNIRGLAEKTTKPNVLILKIKGNTKSYEKLCKEDPLTFVAERIARNTVDYDNKIIIEFEAPDDGNYEAHKKRIDLVKKINPGFKIATSLEKDESYDNSSNTWDPEKSKKYWEDSDIIILEDYFSKPSDLEKSIQKFKTATKGRKQVWVRVVVGNKRINTKGIENLEADLKEYEQTLNVVQKHADGCLVSDADGTWLFSRKSYDKNETLKRTKQLYKIFRKIKIERTYSYAGYG